MNQSDKYLHTTHRTVSWFNKAFQRHELELSAPFQRNPVWTNVQKAYLIDTILHGLPVPELYMQEIVDDEGNERHIVVDGQQRVRAVLDFAQNEYALDGGEVADRWRGLSFDRLSVEEKQIFFAYKFVVRVLPDMRDEELRRIFARLNRNVVALNQQELRNATYWGPFIQSVQGLADEDPFWAESGIFTANDHRRMLDHEFISELAIAYLHGPQNKKDKLDYYYQLYEEEFERRADMVADFIKTTSEIMQILPDIRQTRWKKKSDFYTLFRVLLGRVDDYPMASDTRRLVADRVREFGRMVDRLVRLEEEEWVGTNPLAVMYARNVARAASDRANRIKRAEALASYVFPKD
jgi:hypothetical protein